ncbi:hypothetical protein C2E23DRAFT_503445 [Lenzites betulinus]|nr:hypothetical protein C2E23DRAFT_503445 [Lenzites betulinus]
MSAQTSETSFAGLTSLYENARSVNNCGIGLAVLLAYDTLLNMEREVSLVWQSQKSWVSRVIYVLNRYTMLFSSLLQLGVVPSISDSVSRGYNSSTDELIPF